MGPRPATAMARARPSATGTARDPYGTPATGRDKVAATAALVMARTSTNVPAASAVTARARLPSSWWPCRNTTALRSDGPWDEAITRHAAAVQAAQQIGDRPGQALALTDLGDIRQPAGDYPGAVRDLTEALGICRDLGDRPGQAGALTSLALTLLATGDYPAAVRDLQEALGICRDLGDRPG
jgi:tetratricopeptide (TPR) repeat protein